MDLYSDRSLYRSLQNADDLTYFRVTVEESDLCIGAKKDLACEALSALKAVRREISEYIALDNDFLTSLVPLELKKNHSGVIKHMIKASASFGVGPMAAVAGAVSENVGKALRMFSEEVIVENGGDIYLYGQRERTVALWAPGSTLSGKIGVVVNPAGGLGVCTSAGTYGHSLSFGHTQAAMVICRDTLLADAGATKLGNLIKTTKDISSALEEIIKAEEVIGAVAVINDSIGFMGDVEITAI